MARTGRPTSRPGSGPGRGSRRRRSLTGGTAGAAGSPISPIDDDLEDVEVDAERTRELSIQRRRSGITSRAIALGVVVLLLTISYASSLRVFFEQRQEIAATEAEIAQREQHITDLEAELKRWDDPEYVKAQARERLGWVVPGEKGYRVVGRDGKPLVPGAEVAPDDPDEPATWWEKLGGSMQAADGPKPATPDPSAPPEPTAPPKTVGPEDPEPTKKPT